MGSALRVGTDRSLDFNTGLDISYPLDEKWQITVPFVIAHSINFVLTAYVGPQYNFGAQDLMNSYFVNAKIGAEITSVGASFLVGATFGKRWKLTESITYHPSFNIFSNVSARSGVFFAVTPIAFSLMLDVL